MHKKEISAGAFFLGWTGANGLKIRPEYTPNSVSVACGLDNSQRMLVIKNAPAHRGWGLCYCHDWDCLAHPGTASVSWQGQLIARSLPIATRIKLSKAFGITLPLSLHSFDGNRLSWTASNQKTSSETPNTSITSNPPILEPWWKKQAGAGHPLSHIGGHNVKKFNQDLHQVFSKPNGIATWSMAGRGSHLQNFEVAGSHTP